MYYIQFDKYHSHSRIIEIIGSDKIVLDVGCGDGKMARRLTERGCTVFGIEIDEERAREAKIYCKEVLVKDIETIEIFPYSEEMFDVIILADILEHLRKPSKVLINLQKYLKKNGIAIASIPNVANWSVRLNLLFGRFPRTEGGILSKDHIQFFTKKMVMDLFSKSNLFIQKIDVTPGLNTSEIYETSLFKLLGRMKGYGFLNYILSKMFKGLFAYQFIIVAKKKVISYG